MKTSLIIPTYNEKPVLTACIESLCHQTYKDFEIIVVDDGSTDKTSEVLRNLQSSIYNFQFFEQKHKGPGAARNLGARRAKGKVLVFVDADMEFDKDFILNLTKPIFAEKVKGTFSKEEIVSNWQSVWARCWSINEDWEEKRRHPKEYPDHQPVFRAILKSEFDKVGGFTPGGYDDDWSLSKKLGYEATNSPGAVFYHKNPSSLREIFEHSRWVSKRKYKLGVVGCLISLARASLPISLLVGIYKSISMGEPAFVVFKCVYDLGIFLGILEFMFTGKTSK